MTRPHGITGSLTPTFVPARAVALAVRRPSAFALIVRLPTALRAPLRASVTISEATAPVKLPASHGPRRCKRPREIVNKTRVEFHCWLPQGQNPGIVASHLCYAIHAGRNFPDKEFRYLTTVIVTAAVYRRFGNELCLAADKLR